MRRAQAINGFGAAMTGVVLVIVLITKFTRGAWIAIAAMAVFYAAHAGHPPALRPGRAELAPARPTRRCPRATTRSCWCRRLHKPTLRALAYARATRPDVLEALTVNVDDADTRRSHASGTARAPGAAQGRRLAVPGDHPAGPRLRQARAPRQPARRRHRLHPGVRRRALVGAAAAQPERAAAQGPAAVPARGDGDQRAVAAGVVGGCGPRPETVPGAARRGYGPLPSTTGPPRRRPLGTTRGGPAWVATGRSTGPTGCWSSCVGPVAHGGHCVARA